MRKFILSFGAIFLFVIAQSQTVIAVQHGSTTTLETRLDSAIAHAQSGDVIYLPGGLISGSAGVTVNKKLSVIGAGYHPDSSKATSPTTTSGGLTLSAGGEGSLLTGISINGDVAINCINTIITRCNLGSLAIYSSNTLIEENIIRGFVNEGNTSNPLSLSNVMIRKNIMYAPPTDVNSVTFSNNIILDGNNSTNSSSFYYVWNCYFINNIITSSFNYPLTYQGNQFYNNLFTSSYGSSTNNNVSNEPIANIFLNYTSGLGWKSSQNFHLKAGSKAIGLGTDGTDAGVYGTVFPFKEGGMPFNPHYQSVVIPASTNPNGMLNINITIKAQDH
ncbi:MAG: hypothetical protein JWQ09_3287 [Segetibacter sp.]|nr:hypothetical protein [Segetibacter sp.]